MESFDIIWVIIVIIFGIFKFIKRASADESSQETEEAQETETQPEQEDGPGAPVFAYYYTHEGQKKVNPVKSAKASGRELTEYEIYSEQQRLDKLWCAELERLEQEAMEAREEVYASVEPVETPDMDEIKACARRGAADHIMASVRRDGAGQIDDEPERPFWDTEPVQDTRNSDREYQLEQLERWLEAGLIDKKEYKRRKREL